MFYKEFKYLSEAIRSSLAPLAALQLESAKTSLDALTEITKELYRVIPPLDSPDQLKDISLQLANLCKDMLSNIEFPSVNLESINFLNEINFQDEYIELNEDDCDSINTLLESSNISDNTVKISKGKMALYAFLKKVLIPIFTVLLPMMQNSYYQKINSIESQKAYIEERQLKEEEIQLLKEQILLQEQQLQLMTDYVESLEDTLNELIDCVKLQEYSQEIPKSDSVFLENSKLSDSDLESLDKD